MNAELLIEPLAKLNPDEQDRGKAPLFLQMIDQQLNRRPEARDHSRPDLGPYSREVNVVDLRESNVVDLPEFKPLQYRPTEFFAAVQEWEGVVTAIGEGVFYADLVDISAGSEDVTEKAEISFADIDPGDVDRVRTGAVFRWLIGHSRTRSGRFSRKWEIYFRRARSSTAQVSPLSKVKIPHRLKTRLEVDPTV